MQKPSTIIETMLKAGGVMDRAVALAQQVSDELTAERAKVKKLTEENERLRSDYASACDELDRYRDIEDEHRYR